MPHEEFLAWYGEWQGTKELLLPWISAAHFTSPSRLRITSVAKEHFAQLGYSWQHEGMAQEGLILIGYDPVSSRTTGAWVDSWHQSGGIMACTGQRLGNGVFCLLGHYEVGNDAPWGWRIKIAVDAINNLKIEMYNISPAGDEERVVSAHYERA
jgi:hypothetical protein